MPGEIFSRAHFHVIAEGQTSSYAEGDHEKMTYVRSLPMLKETSNNTHIKSFAGQVTAVDAFYSIHKVTIFNTEQLILEIQLSFAVRRISTVERKIISRRF